MGHQVTLRRWSGAAGRYIPWTVEVDAPPVLSCDDMEVEVGCARCGRTVQYGSTYTSQQVHDELGFGYAVCPECHDAEMAEEALWGRM